MKKLIIIALLLSPGLAWNCRAADSQGAPANRPERLEWFRDQGFGLFIHWSVDSQIGTVISHSLVGASDDYVRRFFDELPRTFNPHQFQPEDWAALAKLAGIRYVVFTAKHHSGFCMYDTATTDFGIMHTPFKGDVTAEVLAAFRRQGIAAGLYFSPDDFHWLNEHGKTIARFTPEVEPSNNPGLLAYDTAQVRELLSNYGAIDIFFIDGEAEQLRQSVWQLQPNSVVTRGAMRTPELHTMDKPLDEPWEACVIMGTAWQYQPTLENYKSGGQCISLLVRTRAAGGNLLLDVGPKPNGELPIEQEERLREIATWMFINGECIHGVRPWIVMHEKGVWFTRKKSSDALYAIIDDGVEWPFGTWKDIVLKSVRAGAQTSVAVLGQSDEVLEYHNDIVPKTTWRQEPDGLHIRAMRAQRIHDDRKWPNPTVLKLTHVQPAIVLPRVATVRVTWSRRAARFAGTLEDLGDSASVKVGFEYHDITGENESMHNDVWTGTPATGLRRPGDFGFVVKGLTPGRTYEMRAVARHPLAAVYGDEMTFQAP